MILYLDIETTTDNEDKNYFAFKTANVDKRLKDPVKIAEAQAKAMEKFPLSPLTGRIMLIGLLCDDKDILKGYSSYQEFEDCAMMQFDAFDSNSSETGMLKEFWAVCAKVLHAGGKIVTFNGKAFDFPFLFVRSLITDTIPQLERMNEIFEEETDKSLHLFEYFGLTARYNANHHIDLWNIFNPNYGDYNSLTEIAYRLGVSTDLISEGGEIANWLAIGNYQAIKDKNMMDLFKTFYIYEKVKRLW